MNENIETAKIIKWIRKNPAVWELICGDGWNEFTISDYIDIMEDLVSIGMYPFALILLSKASCCMYLDEAIDTIIINRITKPNPNIGILTETIEEMKNIGNKKSIMKNKITIN